MDCFHAMTEEEKKIICNSYHFIMDDRLHAGQRMVFTFLDDYPDYKVMWPKFRDVSDSHLMAVSQTFSDTFLNALDLIIRSWKDPDLDSAAHAIAHKLHDKHKEHLVGRTHVMHLYEAFLPVLKRNAHEEFNPEMENAYKKLFESLAAKLID